MIAPARVSAYTVLRRVLTGRDDLPAAIARTRPRMADDRDRALVAEIATGTLRRLAALDHIIAALARRPPADLDPEVLDILRLSVYQILYLDRIPPAAVVDDAVELTRRARRPAAAGLVNAALRALVRTPSMAALPDPPALDQGERPAGATREAALDYLTVTLSHPRWLVRRWLDRYGFEAAATWTRFNNEPAPLVLRANPRRITPDTLAEKLSDHGVHVRPGRYAPDALVVTDGHPLRTPLADQGLFIVQNEASQLVSWLVATCPGYPTLDACAAPGGKTIALAGTARRGGLTVAADRRPRRVVLLAETLERVGLTSVRLVRLDLETGLPFRRVFRRVLVDAPCSGLGTIRGDPEIRWRRSAADLVELAAAQRHMLDQAAYGVADGGYLVYSTCSSEPEENESVVDGFLERHRQFARLDPRHLGAVPPGPAAVLDDLGQLRTLPHLHGLDAFYGAVLVRGREAWESGHRRGSRRTTPPDGRARQ